MEKLAQTVLGDRPKIYYAGGADDEECQLSLGVERKEEEKKKKKSVGRIRRADATLPVFASHSVA